MRATLRARPLVAAGAVRYYLLKFSLNQIISFDFDEALRVTGDTGVYLQYAHARAAGILRKVTDDGVAVAVPAALHPAGAGALHSIEAYTRALTETALALSPSLLTTYAFGLASAFSDFYEHTPAMVREEDAGDPAVPASARRGDARDARRRAPHPGDGSARSGSEQAPGAGMIRSLQAPFV